MTARPTYKVHAVRSGKWWALETPSVPRARSQARRLDQAEGMIREAIAMVAGVDEDSFDVTITPMIEGPLGELVEVAVSARQAATAARETASAAVRNAVQAGTEAGLTNRDIAQLLGVSHQYVAKL